MALRPLITAAEAFPVLERLAASAREELCLSFRVFDPESRLRAPELREKGLENWIMLLRWVLSRNVSVRILIADFDPLFASDLHRNAWRCASVIADKLGNEAEVLCAPHGHRAGRAWHVLMARAIRKKLAAFRQEDPVRLTPLQRQALAGDIVLRPVSLHQKFAVADRSRCIIGGLDVDERRFDDPTHERPTEQTWHDVSIEADGHFADVLRGHFATCWNDAIDAGTPILTDHLSRFDTTVRAQNTRDISLVRTLSKPRAGWMSLAPSTVLDEHEKVLVQAIGQARQRIYIETQFLRHFPLAQALAAAARQAPDLNLICVLPAEPENVLYQGDDGPGARHAQALQMRAIELLQEAFGDRLALVSPAQPWSAPPDAPGQMEGAAPVYLHSKVTVIDRAFAMVGSANLNGRSMRWDTEASILFRDPQAVDALWTRLAGKWLGDTRTAIDSAATWRQAALADMARAADGRKGYLLPYPITRNQKFARWRRFVPDEMF